MRKSNIYSERGWHEHAVCVTILLQQLIGTDGVGGSTPCADLAQNIARPDTLASEQLTVCRCQALCFFSGIENVPGEPAAEG